MPKGFDALQRSPRHVDRWQRAQRDLLQGRSDRALEVYQELLKQYPDTEGLWFEYGLAAVKQQDFDLADRAFQRTAELAARDVAMLVLVGQQYHLLRRLGKARDCFERAAAADPASIHAQLSLVDWCERERRLDAAWECLEACLARHPRDAQVLCVKALLLHRLKRHSEAETLLREVIHGGSPDLNVKYTSRQQLAVVLDELGQYSEAMRWLMEAKAVLRPTVNLAQMERDYDRSVGRRRELLAALTPETIQIWRREGATAADSHRLAFLGGHPRSGTTLLEQILGAHSGIAAFDESMAFVQEVSEKLAPLNAPAPLTLNTLNSLTAAQRVQFQQRYRKSLFRDGTGEPSAVVWLDKNPSPTASLHLWLRLFPELKVIIALRDPRDVIISCFFQNLRLNTTNANFLSLERTARHYADLMDVWLRMKKLGGFDWIESRYEDVVVNRESEGRRITDFLGLAWQPQQGNSHESAGKTFVFAPTYSDVAKPVHDRAIGRWQHYAEDLAPIQAQLDPYCRAFNYT